MSNALTHFRKERDLTLKDVAAQVGVSEGHLSRVSSEGTVMLPLALKLAALTGLPVEMFVRTGPAPKRDGKRRKVRAG